MYESRAPLGAARVNRGVRGGSTELPGSTRTRQLELSLRDHDLRDLRDLKRLDRGDDQGQRIGRPWLSVHTKTGKQEALHDAWHRVRVE